MTPQLTATRPGRSRTVCLPHGPRVQCVNADDVRYVYAELWQGASSLKYGVRLRPGSRVLDVGANLGLFALWAYEQCRGRAEVHCFEPAPAVFDLLRRNLAAWAPHALHAHPFGLSDQDETALLRFHPQLTLWSTRDAEMDAVRSRELEGAAGNVVRHVVADFRGKAKGLGRPLAWLVGAVPFGVWTRLLRRRVRDYGTTVEVPCPFIRLGDFLRQHRLTTIDLLKIDTEGDELRVLQGLDAGQWSGIRQVVLEVDGDADHLRAVLELLGRQGFEVADEELQVHGRSLRELGCPSHHPRTVYAWRD
jgi:FkbM family methyltransferase